MTGSERKRLHVMKAAASVVLSLIILLSGIGVPVFGTDGTGTVKAMSDYVPFDTDKTYHIWLKQGSSSADDPLSQMRQTCYRWNINGSGSTFNAVVHLDYQSGDNCEMKFEDVGDGYYGIRYEDSKYWIDTEGNNGKTGEVLHQYHDDEKPKRENQYFKFIPVDGEDDTYYIVCKKGDVYIGTENNKAEQYAKIATVDFNNAQKWVIKPTDALMLTGDEVKLPGSQNGLYKPSSGAPVFMLNPQGYQCDVNVNDNGSGVGDCLHLYELGTSAKITAEWIEAKQAYRLRSYSMQDQILTYQVWDVDDQSLKAGAVVHVWTNQGDEHASQLWRFIPAEGKNGVYYIYNVNSGMYLSIEGGLDAASRSNDKNDVKLVQSATALPWELHLLNPGSATEYKVNASGDEINPGNWMSKLPDDMLLSQVNIPGTHDAGAANELMFETWATCQQLYLHEQLNAGVRAWDIRIDRASASTESDPNIIHGEAFVVCLNSTNGILELEEVMDTAKAFLEKHPEETIVMTLKGDSTIANSVVSAFDDPLCDDVVARHVVPYITNSDYPIYRTAKGGREQIPTIGQVRGKIVFVSRLSLTEDYINELETASNELDYSILDTLGPDAGAWDSNDYSSTQSALRVCDQVYVQDNYEESDATVKVEYFRGTVDDATSSGLTDHAYLFNYSAAKDNMSQPRAINRTLMEDPRLAQPDSLSNKKSLGIVMTNMIDGKLSEKIYMTNFAASSGQSAVSQFTDVRNDWSYDGISYCVDRGLMKGTSRTTFDPDGTTARGMLVTVLYRIEGEPAAGICSFTDVPAGAWYTDAVAWAAENGIVEGYDGRFVPDGDITREAFAAVLYRYAKYKGYDVSTGENTSLQGFADADRISVWAEDAMQWAVGEGLINGRGNGMVDPSGNASRAEMAAILYRFCEKTA